MKVKSVQYQLTILRPLTKTIVCMRNRQLAKECETIGRNHAPILNE